MCGICGIFGYGDSARVDEAELRRSRDAMRRRGPDGANMWVTEDGRVGLGHRRLAIIDPSDRGAQPMASVDGRYWITFNGEIYNYRSLRRSLQSNGSRFRTETDTEVLLNLYAERCTEMLPELRGMYALAIWDGAERTLFLARDPLGVKPLYLADDGVSVRFASQVKALLAFGKVNRKPDWAGSVGFFLWGAVPEPHTLYESIQALPAGSHVTYGVHRAGQPRKFFSLQEELAREDVTDSERAEQSVASSLQEALRDSIRQHLVADVPVGVFLSGGLDSTTVAGVASESAPGRLRTITLGFREYAGTAEDEASVAESVARTYDTYHHTEIVSKEDFAEALPDLLEVMDQPSIDGVNTYFVARAAARAGLKVALSGLGGDELLGGYSSFTQVPRLAGVLRPFSAFPALGRAVRRATCPLVGRLTSPKYAGLFEYGSTLAGAYLLRRALFMPWELEGFLDPTVVREGLERLATLSRLRQTISGLTHPAQCVAALEMEWYMRNQLLRDADWAGMAHSVEIRVPFVDVPLLRVGATFLKGDRPPGKRDVAATPRRPLPVVVLKRAKTGFGTPVSSWVRQRGDQATRWRGLRGWAMAVYRELTNQ